MLKKTKIVCTIGPASESKEVLENLMRLGMNVCRLNFSHGTHEEHLERINNIKEVRAKLDFPIAIMLDTKGPEIRLGEFGVDSVSLAIGDEYTFTTRDVLGDETICSVSYKDLPKDVQIGSRILIDDGLVEFEVKELTDTDIICQVANHGVIKSRKGVNVPNTQINLPAITDKDISDIKFGIENGIDYIAASFIRKAQDVIGIRKILEENGGGDIQIISKIESQEGVDNLDEIIEASDGIMVARGDLGVEIKTEAVPIVQKEIIRKTSSAGKPVITATQMLDSMIRNPRPTRAEVNDVANAILDGTDAIMLSGETAAGNYPENAVRVMYDIAITTESSKDFQVTTSRRLNWMDLSTTNAISLSTRTIAEQLDAEAILTATTSGATAKAVSKFRPLVPIIATTTRKEILRKLALVWGVYPILSETSDTTDEVIEDSITAALSKNYIHMGDLVIITAGIPVGIAGMTNLLKVHTVGKILVEGTGIGKHSVTAKIVIGDTDDELKDVFEEGDILVAHSIDIDNIEYARKASGIIAEEGGLTSQAAVVGLHLKIPTIVGAVDCTTLLKGQECVTLDPKSGVVYHGEAKAI